jgi:hypothetical protein
MKIDFVSNFLGEAIVWRTESQSRPGMFHYTSKLRAGGIVCSCEGWQYNGYCKHMENLPAEKVEAAMKAWHD